LGGDPYPVVDAMAHNPDDSLSVAEYRDKAPPTPGDLGIDKQVLELLGPRHAQGAKAVAGLDGTQEQGEKNAIPVHDHPGGIIAEPDGVLSLPLFHEDRMVEVAEIVKAWPGDLVPEWLRGQPQRTNDDAPVTLLRHRQIGKMNLAVCSLRAAEAEEQIYMVEAETGQMAAGNLQPPAKQPSLECRVGLEELGEREVQDALSPSASMAIQPVLYERSPKIFLVLEDGRGSHQSAIQIAIEMIPEEREDLEAQAISLAPGLQVRVIFTPLETMTAKVVQDFRAAAGEERADDAAGAPGSHSLQAPGAGSAEEPEEKLLGLVVGVVTQGESVGPPLGHDPGEKLGAKGARRHLERASVRSLPGADIDGLHHRRQMKGLGHGGDKAGVLVRLLSSEAMVDVSHHELHAELAPEPVEEMTESDGVGPAGDGHNDPSASGLDHPVTRDGLTNFVEEHRNIPSRRLQYYYTMGTRELVAFSA
jgi:hypothetical protein